MTGNPFLLGASCRITLEIEPQTGRRDGQEQVQELAVVLFSGCLDALSRLGEAASFVREIVITFSQDNGAIYVYPSVSIILQISSVGRLLSQEAFAVRNMVFSSSAAKPLSVNDISLGVERTTREAIFSHGLTLKAIAEVMSGMGKVLETRSENK